MKSLKVQCKNAQCPWQGELRSLTRHLDSCDYATVSCPTGCNIKLLARKDLEFHLKAECLKRDYTCPHCTERGRYEEMTTVHLEKCPERMIKCPNHGCNEQVAHWILAFHQSTCDYELVSCKYTEVGCEERPLSKDLKKHEEDGQLNLQLTMDKVTELNKKVAGLEAQLEEKNEHKTILEKKIQESFFNFNFKVQRFLNGSEFQSPPFYTSQTGYRMCVKVLSDYKKDASHLYISVYAHS